MKFYDEPKPLYIEKDTSGVRLEAASLQTEVVQVAPGIKH